MNMLQYSNIDKAWPFTSVEWVRQPPINLNAARCPLLRPMTSPFKKCPHPCHGLISDSIQSAALHLCPIYPLAHYDSHISWCHMDCLQTCGDQPFVAAGLNVDDSDWMMWSKGFYSWYTVCPTTMDIVRSIPVTYHTDESLSMVGLHKKFNQAQWVVALWMDNYLPLLRSNDQKHSTIRMVPPKCYNLEMELMPVVTLPECEIALLYCNPLEFQGPMIPHLPTTLLPVNQQVALVLNPQWLQPLHFPLIG